MKTQLPSFESEWAKKNAAGYQYGADALEHVRLGYKMAVDALAKKGSYDAVFGHLDMTPDEIGNRMTALEDTARALLPLADGYIDHLQECWDNHDDDSTEARVFLDVCRAAVEKADAFLNPRDFHVSSSAGSSIYMLTPLSIAANEWVAEHIPDDAQKLGNAIAIEHRYVEGVLEGIEEYGLTVERT